MEGLYQQVLMLLNNLQTNVRIYAEKNRVYGQYMTKILEIVIKKSMDANQQQVNLLNLLVLILIVQLVFFLNCVIVVIKKLQNYL